jgi:hypothetical protein
VAEKVRFANIFTVSENDKTAIDRLVRYMRRHAHAYGAFGRFYMFMESHVCYTYEQEKSFETPEGYDYCSYALTMLFTEWRKAMGEAAWVQLLHANETANSANQNFLLGEYDYNCQRYGI